MEMLLTTSDVAKLLNRSADRVRGYEREGRLRAERTRSGVRLFKSKDVEQLARQLAKTRKRSGVSAMDLPYPTSVRTRPSIERVETVAVS